MLRTMSESSLGLITSLSSFDSLIYTSAKHRESMSVYRSFDTHLDLRTIAIQCFWWSTMSNEDQLV